MSPGVLRILPVGPADQNGSAVMRVRLVGRVSGRWVDELRRVCMDALDAGLMVDVDMRDVSFVDGEGLRLFREFRGRRLRLNNCALFVAEQLKALEQDV
jgi:hypothetical protein